MESKNYNYHSKVGKADYAFKRLTIEDMVNYKKSEGLGRMWQKITLGFSGKGLVDTATINQMMSHPSVLEDLKTEKQKLMAKSVGEFVNNDLEIRASVEQAVRTALWDFKNYGGYKKLYDDTVKFVLDVLSQAVNTEVIKAVEDKGTFENCKDQILNFLAHPSLLNDYIEQPDLPQVNIKGKDIKQTPKEREIFNNIKALNSIFGKIKSKVDEFQKKNYVSTQSSKRQKFDG